MAPGSRGVGAVFVHFSDADSGQTGDAIGEPRVPRRSRSHYLSNAPGLADQLVASRKDSAREGGSCAAYFCKVPDSRESELGLVRYGPASRVHRGVFGPFEGSFPIGIPADPDKFLAIREFHVVHGCVLFPMCPGSQINLLRVRKTLCASVATSVRQSRNFQQNLILPCTEASLGSRDMILRTEAVGMFLMLRVLATTLLFLVRFRPVKYEIEALDILYTLVKGWSVRSSFWSGPTVRSNLGQTWSTLVKLGRTWSKLSKLLEMYPGLHFKGFWARWVLVGLETARSNLGQTLVNSSQTWSTLVKLGQTLGNVSRTFFLGVFEVMSPRRNRPTWFGLPRFACRHPGKSRGKPCTPRAGPSCAAHDGPARVVFWRSSGTQNGSCGISSESSRRPLSNDIKFARIGVRTRELWLPEVGVSELFLCTLSDVDSGQTGNAIGEPRVPRRSRSHYLSNAPGLADQLVASRKDSAREGGSCAAYFCKVLDLWKSELGLVRYGPANRGHRGVFGPFEGSFPIGIPAGPDKILGDPRVPRRAWMCLLSNVPGLADQLVASQEDSVRKRDNVGGEIPELSAKPYFVGLFSRAWPCIEAKFGFARYDLANGGRRNVPYAKGGGQFDPVFGLVNGPVKPWSNLVNLGQTWSNLVKALQTLGDVSQTTFQGFPGTSNLVEPREMCPGPSSWEYLMRRSVVRSCWFGSGCLDLRTDTRENPVGKNGVMTAVTFDYIPGEDMWRLLFRIEDIWGGRLSEMVLIEGGLHGDSSVTPDFVEWREGWSPSFTLRPTVRPGASYSSVSQSLRASAPTGQASEREESAARVESMRSSLHHNSVAVANLRRDLEVQRGNVSTLRTMNDFIREQLEISEAAKDHMEETLTETQGQLETKQVERTRVQDELDSLRSYTQALVDPSTGRPHDIVALRRALDESETEVDLVHDALESNASWLNQEGFPVVTALHQVNQVMDSLGARARAVLEEHDEGDPALSTALGRFCRETCIRLGH
uniref:Uncharacterized protein n=1 Tax=Fagus sylvatica TaxID=28930 RepID=A0A2N9GX88_FAGSY